MGTSLSKEKHWSFASPRASFFPPLRQWIKSGKAVSRASAICETNTSVCSTTEQRFLNPGHAPCKPDRLRAEVQAAFADRDDARDRAGHLRDASYVVRRGFVEIKRREMRMTADRRAEHQRVLQLAISSSPDSLTCIISSHQSLALS